MGIFGFKKFCWNKRYIISCIITLLLSIICGIVLYIIAGNYNYFKNFANIYVRYIFNFKNGKLFFSHFFGDLFLFYIAFLISYFIGRKFFTLPIIFFKGCYTVFYTLTLCLCIPSGGIPVAFLVFFPCSLLSLFCVYLIGEQCKAFNGRYAPVFPLYLSLATSLIFLIFVNVIFRFIVVIV